jgi:solute carrier family 29 (equilibrative nucleoside transporter), member 1/2/3
VVAILGACDSIVQGSLFGLVGLFSPRYVSGFMTGQGFAGLTVSLLRIISKVSFANDAQGIRTSSYIFFGLSVIVIIASVAAYQFVLRRSPVTRHYLSKSTADLRSRFSRFVTVPMSNYDARRDAKDVAVLSGTGAAPAPPASEELPLLAIWWQIWPMALTVFGIFFVTLALFPGITSEMTSTNASLNAGQWFGIIQLTMFQVGDVIGRSIPNAGPRVILQDQRVIGLLSALRVIFLPLFIFQVRHDNIFTQDAYAYIIMLGFAISNGYLGTVSMMRAVDSAEPRLKELTGTFMVFFLTCGTSWLAPVLLARAVR